MSVPRKIIFLFLFLLLLSGCSLVETVQAPVEKAAVAVDVYQKAEEISEMVKSERSVQLNVDFSGYGGQDILEYVITPDEDLNALSILEESGLDLEIKEYDFGNLVNAIEGVEGGVDDRYWIYYVNDELGQVAADQNILEAGDRVLWRFEESVY